MDKIKEELYEAAHASIVIASDYQNFLDHTDSFIFKALKEEGFPEEDATVIFTSIGEKETGAAEAYLHTFSLLGIEPEYDSWSQEDGRFEAAKKDIVETLHASLQDAGLNPEQMGESQPEEVKA